MITASDLPLPLFPTDNTKLVAVEIDPPMDGNSSFIDKCGLLYRQSGADILTVSDNPLGRSRADAGLISVRLRRDYGLPVICHIACRDKNISAICSALMGLFIENIRGVLIVTGDPMHRTLAGEVKSVFNLDAVRMIAKVSDMNKTLFGEGLKIGAALNVNVPNFTAELDRAQRKEEAGARFFITQPIFDDYGYNNLIKARKKLDSPFLAGVLPIVSHKNALFIQNEVTGINIPDNIVSAFEGVSREDSLTVSVDVSMRLIRQVWDLVSGYHIITPLKRSDIVAGIIRGIKE